MEHADFIEGAGTIAAYLKAKGFSGMTPKRVYRLKDVDGWPIVRIPGIGMSARTADLDDYLNRLFSGRTAGESNGDRPQAQVEDKERRLHSVGR